MKIYQIYAAIDAFIAARNPPPECREDFFVALQGVLPTAEDGEQERKFLCRLASVAHQLAQRLDVRIGQLARLLSCHRPIAPGKVWCHFGGRMSAIEPARTCPKTP